MLNRRQFILALAAGGYALPLWAETSARSIHQIEIKDFAFKPSRIEVRAGEIVEWVNRDFAPHTATANDNSWDTGMLANNAVGHLVMTHPGTLAYHCTFHPDMKGVVTVVG
ncbi:copper-binding protein [Burkholderia sp. Bp9143]|uniref:cupredoxin domain-containing protein n=1 Tax=Burkholderia sp. Bp9143 TaxID=2184574 RepID=UPI000F5B081D|nr:cupredoxin family copper-binding protein [Burkholderia sp. Bp9143]RQR22297.1 copper-binding protein [Burkholderia sp. Bp9143]